MFKYEVKNKQYWIGSDNIKWLFWPFTWIFIKNKYIWDINENMIDENKYPWYKYSIWVRKKEIFIISEKGIEKLILS